jgi:hypothetical protein
MLRGGLVGLPVQFLGKVEPPVHGGIPIASGLRHQNRLANARIQVRCDSYAQVLIFFADESTLLRVMVAT